MKKLFPLLVLNLFIFILAARADNTGQINGTVTDSITGETLIGANVSVMVNGTLRGTAADVNGYYVIKPLEPGMYDVKVSYTGYATVVNTEVRVSQNSISIVNVRLSKSAMIKEVVVRAEEFIKADVITGHITGDDLAVSAVRGVDANIVQLPGVYQADDGGEIYFRGSRSDATEYYIDNVKVIGDHNIPNVAIAEINVYSGGIPARYGDVTGGVIAITTKSYNMYHRGFQ